MRPYLLIVAAATACFDDGPTEENPVPVAQEPAPAPKAAEKTVTFEDKVATARGAALSGADGAVDTVQELLDEKPEDAALWRLLGYAARATGGEAALVDELQGGEAPGGQAGLQHLLVAELALAAGRAEAAAAAARAAQADHPDAAAALLAEAARAGAALSADVPKEPTPADALARYAAAPDKRKAARFAEKAGEVAGWRASLLRARVKRAHGDREGAAAELDAAAAASDPRAKVAALLLKAELAEAGELPAGEDGVAPGIYEAARWTVQALGTAVEDGDGGTFAAQGPAAVRLALRGQQADGAFALTSKLLEGASGDAVEARLLHATAALASGHPVDALAAAKAAREAAEGDATARAAWLEGRAAVALGDVEGLNAAVGALDGARAQALRALSLGLAGAPAAVVGELPASGLSPSDAGLVWLEAGRLGGPSAIDALGKAVKAADASGDVALLMESRLALESVVRTRDPAAAARLRKALHDAAPPGAPGDALRAELAVRDLLAGAPADLAGDGPLPAWAAVAAGVAASGGSGPVHKWAEARADLRAGKVSATLRYAEALAHAPLHRQGILSTGTAALGAAGFPVEGDFGMLVAAEPDEGISSAALNVSEAAHRLAAAQADHLQGRDLLAGLSAEQRTTLLSAVARARAQARSWLAAGGDFPQADFDALAAVETELAKDSTFRQLAPATPPSLSDLRTSMGGAAILSYASGPQQLYGVVVTPTGGRVRDLGSRASWVADCRSHRAALAAAANSAGKADLSAGDRLRKALLDPFTAELTGIGRYQVVADTSVMSFPVTTFPEQASGLRFLADIRTVSSMPTLGSIRITDGKAPAEKKYRPDFLGLGAPKPVEAPPEAAAPAEDGAAGEGGGAAPAKEPDAMSDEAMLERHRAKRTLPVDLVASGRSFGEDFKELHVGEALLESVWTEKGPTARYVQFSQMDPSADGGFVVADGELTLSEIRATRMQADIVVVTASAPGPVQLQRARAFLDAGAAAVIVLGWDIDEAAQERFFDGYFAAINRDRPAARALGEARESLMRDALMGIDNDDPGLWGSVLLFSAP